MFEYDVTEVASTRAYTNPNNGKRVTAFYFKTRLIDSENDEVCDAYVLWVLSDAYFNQNWLLAESTEGAGSIIEME